MDDKHRLIFLQGHAARKQRSGHPGEDRLPRLRFNQPQSGIWPRKEKIDFPALADRGSSTTLSSVHDDLTLENFCRDEAPDKGPRKENAPAR